MLFFLFVVVYIKDRYIYWVYSYYILSWTLCLYHFVWLQRAEGRLAMRTWTSCIYNDNDNDIRSRAQAPKPVDESIK